MTDPKLIGYAVHRMGLHDPSAGAGPRWEIALKNLTKPEATRLLAVLIKMQDAREPSAPIIPWDLD